MNCRLLIFSCIITPYLVSYIPTDLEGAEGSTNVKYGKPNPAQEQCGSLDLDICPDVLLAAIAAAGAAALVALYVALTMQANGRRKRRRSIDHEAHEYFSQSDIFLVGRFMTFQNYGLQDVTEEVVLESTSIGGHSQITSAERRVPEF